MILLPCCARLRPRGRGIVIGLFALGAVLCLAVSAHAQGYGIRAWGSNTNGQLAAGANATTTAMPVRVKASPGGDALTNVVQVASGMEHTLALKADGTVWAWGQNNLGQLGNGTTTASSYPVQVMLQAGTPLSGITSVSAGGYASYAVSGDSIYAWGDNTYAELGSTGLGTTTLPVTYPVQVSLPSTPFSGSVAVSGGLHHALALRTVLELIGGHISVVHTLYAWGDNTYGQLGQGATGSPSATPAVVTLTGATPLSVAAGSWHTVAIDTSGNVWSWGSNFYGESGGSTNGSIARPTQITGIGNAIQVAAGPSNSFAVTQASGSSPVLYAWGNDGYGQLGNGQTLTGGALDGGISSPTQSYVSAPTGVTISSVAADQYATYVLMSNGTVYAAGSDASGSLGSGDFGTPLDWEDPYFQLVQGFTGATAIAAGGESAFALTNDFKFVWQDTVTGIAPYWEFGSATSIANTYQGYIGYFLNTGYSIVAAVDLFQDGNRSLILQNNSTGALAYLRLNGTNVVAGGLIPAAPSYSASEVVVGTMNINGSPAIVWQNKSTGEVDYWTMGLQTINGVVTPVSTGGGKIVAPGSYTWQVAAAYPAGGSNWIIWHDISSDSTAGELVYQQVGTNGAYIANSGRVYQSTVPAGWSLHVEDVNGDGNPDFIWHDTNGTSDPASGETFIWLMNGPSPTFKSSQQVSGLASGQVSIPVEYYIGAIL